MGSRTFVEALQLGPRKKRAKHGVFSPTNMETFSWEELPLKLEAKGRGKKRPTVGRRKKPIVGRRDDLPWVAKATYRRSHLGSF